MTRVTLRMVLGSALLVAGGAVAPAASAAAAPGPLTRITLSVVPEPGTRGDARRMVLTCDPAGPQPNAQQACDELDLAYGEVAQVPPQRDRWCFTDRAPVTASASGWWRGMSIRPFAKVISNDCFARIQYGHVFAF
ncbi:SSI family serine proteinase inhibitor [Actinomadura litoris]|uniref:Subtilisin inhibitor domain-containing protein n=1 Tax=Actinomadura litoris TaxID=2678616 RepID=A0A7K1L496_9ACTN|nr:SSI family serine proteinase inhibitor [Actinomadura litoris]MUN39264.1 hypothetical protein [Actinomadura litoris]